MSSRKRYLKHPVFKNIKEVPIGYSWTMFFFGIFVPLARSDWKAVIIGLGAIFTSFFLDLGIGVPGITTVLLLLFWIIWAGSYNRQYYERLIREGYEEV